MKLSNQLTDYVSDQPVKTINQTLFAEWGDERFGREVMTLATAITPILSQILMAYIIRLPVARPGENMQVDILPEDFAVTVAVMIDEHCPDWNIAQKTAIYLQYMIELRTAAQKQYMHRVHTRPETPAAKAVDGSEDPGEFDIKLPKRPTLN